MVLDIVFRSVFSTGARWFVSAVLILSLGLALRLYGVQYDSGQHIHPDERFLTMVLTAQKAPESISHYFDTANSTLNPHNLGHSFFVYGTFPLFLFQAAAWLFSKSGYEEMVVAQRTLSAIADVGVALLILFFVGRWLGFRIAVTGALAYILCPFAIQQAHFGVVDSIALFFSVLTIGFLIEAKDSRRGGVWMSYAGVAFGLAMASKLSAIDCAGVALAMIAWRIWMRPRFWKQDLGAAVVFGAVSFLIFRIAQPYAFVGPGFWNMSLNPRWLSNLEELKRLSVPTAYFPPAVQWLERSVFFSGWNLVLWGVGLWTVVPFAWGSWIAFRSGKTTKGISVSSWILFWVSVHFIWQSFSGNPTMRYQLPIYPWIFVIAAIGMEKLFSLKRLRTVAITVAGLQVGACLCFASIYSSEDPRIQASRWIYQSIPTGSRILNETSWDMGLPFGLAGFPPQSSYVMENLEMFHPDSKEKSEKNEKLLAGADYLVMSSLRTWGSIGRLPQLYPDSTAFYRKLMGCPVDQSVPRCYAGVNAVSERYPNPGSDYELVYVATRYPGIGPLQINDTLAEEAFTVYDHSKVFIWKRKGAK